MRPSADSVAAAASVAVVTRYVGLPLGSVLDVCADQPTPVGWAPVTDEPTDDVSSCPGAARGVGSTTKRIRRVHSLPYESASAAHVGVEEVLERLRAA
jgi:hypothetical protein